MLDHRASAPELRHTAPRGADGQGSVGAPEITNTEFISTEFKKNQILNLHEGTNYAVYLENLSKTFLLVVTIRLRLGEKVRAARRKMEFFRVVLKEIAILWKMAGSHC